MNREGIADLYVENTISNSPKVPRATFLGWDRPFFCLISIHRFGNFKNSFKQLLACLNFTLDSNDLFCWCKQNNWYLRAMAAGQVAENHEDEWGLTWYFRWVIYPSIPTWTQSQNLLTAAEGPSLHFNSMNYPSWRRMAVSWISTRKSNCW